MEKEKEKEIKNKNDKLIDEVVKDVIEGNQRDFRNFEVRDFDGNLVRKLRVKKPTAQEMEESSLVYKKEYAIAFRSGCLIKAEADKRMKELWTKEDEEKIAKLVVDLQLNENKLMDSNIPDKDKTDIAIKMRRIRAEILELTSIRNNIYNNLAESYADDKRITFLTCKCVVDPETGLVIFPTMEDYYSHNNDYMSQESYFNTAMFLSGIDPDIYKKFPESIFLAKQGLVEFDSRISEKVDEAKEKEEKK